MLSLTLFNIVAIIAVSVQGIPSPQDTGAVVVPTIPTTQSGDGSTTGTTSTDPGAVVVPTIPNSQGGGGGGSSSPDTDSQSSNTDNYRPTTYPQNANAQEFTPRRRPGSQYSRPPSSYREASSRTSSSNVIIQSSQTCGIRQASPDKGVDKIGSTCTSFGESGQYKSINTCPMDMSEAGDYSKDAYPTSNGIQCCAPKSCTPPSKNADGETIDPDKFVGKCMNKHKGANCAYYGGSYVENLCPGPFTIQCCIIPKDNLPSAIGA